MSTEEESMCDTVVEVTPGVGGQEAMLFAQEIYTLLRNYVDFNSWDLELGNYDNTDLGTPSRLSHVNLCRIQQKSFGI